MNHNICSKLLSSREWTSQACTASPQTDRGVFRITSSQNRCFPTGLLKHIHTICFVYPTADIYIYIDLNKIIYVTYIVILFLICEEMLLFLLLSSFPYSHGSRFTTMTVELQKGEKQNNHECDLNDTSIKKHGFVAT